MTRGCAHVVADGFGERAEITLPLGVEVGLGFVIDEWKVAETGMAPLFSSGGSPDERARERAGEGGLSAAPLLLSPLCFAPKTFGVRVGQKVVSALCVSA